MSTPDAPKPEEFFILSLKWTNGDEITWWKPNNSGYTIVLERAGRYTREQIEAHPSYYDDGVDTKAIPCELVEAQAIRVVSVDSKRALLADAYIRVAVSGGRRSP